jgi:hypothetical protein
MHANLKSKHFLEKTFGPVFLCEKVLKKYNTNIIIKPKYFSLQLQSESNYVMKYLCLQMGNSLYAQ